MGIRGCYGLNCAPPPQYVEVLTPSTSEFNLIWKENLYKGNQVKVWSLGWALIECDWVLIKMGNLNTEIDIHRGKTT